MKCKKNRSLANDFCLPILMAFSTILNKLKGNCLGSDSHWSMGEKKYDRKADCRARNRLETKAREEWKAMKNFSLFHAGNVRFAEEKKDKQKNRPRQTETPSLFPFPRLVLSTRLSLVSSGLLAEFNFLVELMNFV